MGTTKPSLVNVFRPSGPFDLLFQNQYFNGWPLLDDRTIVMAFPVEGWSESAAVTVRQQQSGDVELSVHGASRQAGQALEQALAALSLDQDGGQWPVAGERDHRIAELQQKYRFMRPTLFHSPYEATAAFVIGHRLSIAQGRSLRQGLATEHGETFTLGTRTFSAFPGPQALLGIAAFPGLNRTKIDRLHAAAEAALAGWLDRRVLRQLDEAAALERLETIPGIGPFFSQGILHRGAGSRDAITHDDLTYHAMGLRYDLGKRPTREQVLAVAEKWRPYRMWAVVLMHVWLRETGNMPRRSFRKP